MHEHATVGIQQRRSLFQSTAGLQQLLSLIGDEKLHPFHGMALQILDYLVGEMVHIHHHTLETGLSEPFHHMTYQRLSPHRHQGLGHSVSKRAQARAKSGGETHGLSHAYGEFFYY